MAKIVGIKFKNTAKVYYFAPAEGASDDEYKKGDGVIVETARGVEYGIVTIETEEVSEDKVVQPLKPIIRKANSYDKERYKKNEKKAEEAFSVCVEKIKEHNLDMKPVSVEYAFDGSKMVVYFSAPARIDFRDLVKDLASVFRTRIELRQIGIRDEARIIGGLAPCGRPCCCSSYLSDYKKVSIKMAKTQGLSLNPTKISGLCGRLMCCLAFENDFYKDAYKKMPKIGAEVGTPEGKASVVSVNMLTDTVHVKMDGKDGSFVFKDFDVKQLSFAKNNNDQAEKLTKEELEAEKQLAGD